MTSMRRTVTWADAVGSTVILLGFLSGKRDVFSVQWISC